MGSSCGRPPRGGPKADTGDAVGTVACQLGLTRTGADRLMTISQADSAEEAAWHFAAWEATSSRELAKAVLEGGAAGLRGLSVPACQFYWNGLCKEGALCKLRHGEEPTVGTVGVGAVALWQPPRDDEAVLFTSDVDLMSYEELEALTERMGKVTVGVGAAALRKLRRQTWGSVRAGTQTRCLVCQEDFEKAAERVTMLPCGHLFHGACIRRWLADHKKCPTCNQEVQS
eukprot:TRINITY_DN40493_c0_g1_i1.p1 TRINITY_DN40493_c0_g1~~TRINITY_DN40493_c0_g1_i1.p1  ORF type:complete len:229 (+),score=36.30 TRINITY_DN40493_c0_g1_i1:45-731(+)